MAKLNECIPPRCDMQGFIDKPILWGLDPLFHVNVKILAKMLKSMMPGNGTGMQDPPVYFYQFNPRAQPRPIRLVAIAGVVVQKQDYRKVRNTCEIHALRLYKSTISRSLSLL